MCPVAPTHNAIGIDVCANGLYCGVKKPGDVFGTCQLIATVSLIVPTILPSVYIGLELRKRLLDGVRRIKNYLD